MKKYPTHIAYQVQDREDQKAIWNRCGAAWQHEDREGFTIQLDLMPLNGRIILRAAKDDEQP
jgi:hypothetical protein